MLRRRGGGTVLSLSFFFRRDFFSFRCYPRRRVFFFESPLSRRKKTDVTAPVFSTKLRHDCLFLHPRFVINCKISPSTCGQRNLPTSSRGSAASFGGFFGFQFHPLSFSIRRRRRRHRSEASFSEGDFRLLGPAATLWISS